MLFALDVILIGPLMTIAGLALAALGIGGSCLVHRGCFGTPTADVSIRRGSRSRAA